MNEKPRPEYSTGTKAVHAAAYLIEQQAKRAERAEAERDTARTVARAILQMAQEHSGRQFVGDTVLERHPWLKEGRE